MSVNERDPVTGHITTGHEWNGIKELNTPVPRPVWVFLIGATIFALGWTILMPSWPGVTGYFGGLLGVDQHKAVAASIAEANDAKLSWTDTITSASHEDLLADAAAMQSIRVGGKALFGDNCAACHGFAALGNSGFPNIAEAPDPVGERSGDHRRDHPRRHQCRAPRHPDQPDAGVWPRPDAQHR